MPRARVFISSVVEEFREYRAAAARGVESAGYQPILVNEDFPALQHNPRNACLDAVATCDVYICLLGARAGFETPSGRLVVEEEYDEAQRQQLPVLVFVQTSEREDRQDQFVARLSDYVSGHFRVEFQAPEDLEEQVRAALGRLSPVPSSDDSAVLSSISSAIQSPLLASSSRPSLRVAAAPLRSEQIIDPRELESGVVEESLLTIGHESSVGLFSFSSGYAVTHTTEGVRITPQGQQRGQQRGFAAVELHESGLLLVELAIEGEAGPIPTASFMSGLYILEPALERALDGAVSFVRRFWEVRDPYRRYERLAYLAVLCNVRHRTLVANLPMSGNSHPVNMGVSDIVPATPDPRIVTRSSLADPVDEIDRLLASFRRRMRSAPGSAF